MEQTMFNQQQYCSVEVRTDRFLDVSGNMCISAQGQLIILLNFELSDFYQQLSFNINRTFHFGFVYFRKDKEFQSLTWNSFNQTDKGIRHVIVLADKLLSMQLKSIQVINILVQVLSFWKFMLLIFKQGLGKNMWATGRHIFGNHLYS